MVFVQYDAIPMYLLDPLIGSLDATGPVCSQHVLKRGKADKSLRKLNRIKGSVLLLLHKDPILEILVREQIFFPCALYRRLEGQHQHMLPAHPQGQLIGGEGLSEAHLGIPEKVGGQSSVGWVGSKRLKVSSSLTDSLLLLRSHLEV